MQGSDTGRGFRNFTLVLLLLMSSTSTAIGEETATPSLSLNWIDPHQLFAFGSLLGGEVERIFENIDCRVRWVGRRNDSRDGGLELRIVLLPTDPAAWDLDRNTMGVVMSRTEPQRALYVFFPTVARALGYEPKRLQGQLLPARERRLVIRALARIITHEVFHAIAPTVPHAEDGVTRHELDRESLTRGEALLNEESVATFKQELEKLARLERERRDPRCTELNVSGLAACKFLESAPSSPGQGACGRLRDFDP